MPFKQEKAIDFKIGIWVHPTPEDGTIVPKHVDDRSIRH